MSENVTASIVVNFTSEGASGAGILQAAIDARADGLNKGKTTFYPGDSVGFLLYSGANVNIDSVLSSAGDVTPVGEQSVVLTEYLQFADAKSASLQHPALGLGGYKWLGNDGGAISLVDEVNISIAEPVLGVLKVVYKARAYGYKLAGVPHPLSGEYTYTVLVLVEASTA
ncbi:MAG: hypothetical protein JKX92_06160 [Porticoccaceae bacterium]|nr:hypothetical protein [Porticoccaceae bacterium]